MINLRSADGGDGGGGGQRDQFRGGRAISRPIVCRSGGRKLIKGLCGIVGSNQFFTRSRAPRSSARLNPLWRRSGSRATILCGRARARASSLAELGPDKSRPAGGARSEQSREDSIRLERSLGAPLGAGAINFNADV